MSHLESLIAEYLEWQGYLVKRNLKVGARERGGYEMELDIVALDPKTQTIVHCEPSLDALTWDAREERYKKKFRLGKRYMFKEVFDWLPDTTDIEQIAVFPTHPAGRDQIAGATIVSVDELMAEIRSRVRKRGKMNKRAISERYPLLRTLQLSHVGYCRVLDNSPREISKADHT